MRTIILALVVGCTTSPGELGQFGEEEAIRCEEVSRTPVALDDTVEIGYIGQQLQRVSLGKDAQQGLPIANQGGTVVRCFHLLKYVAHRRGWTYDQRVSRVNVRHGFGT